MTEARKSHQKKFTPLGIVFSLLGFLLFVYFIRKAGPGQILEGIKKLGLGFLLIIVISFVRQAARSIAWTLCFDGPERLGFWDALRGRLMGDALGNISGFANVLVSEPAKPAMIRDRVPLMAGLSAITIENIFYSLSVGIFIFAGMAALVLNFNLPEALRIAGLSTLAVIPIGIIVAFILIRRQVRFISRPLGFFHRRGLAEKWVTNGRNLEDRVYGFYGSGGGRFLPILALEFCFHFAGVLEIFVTLSFISLGQPPTFFRAFILESVNRIINVVFKFVPLRMGVDEAGTGKISALLSLTETTGVTLAIIRKGRDVFWTIVGILLLIQRGLTLRTARKELQATAERTERESSVPTIAAKEPS
jgi:hypothetical protein